MSGKGRWPNLASLAMAAWALLSGCQAGYLAEQGWRFLTLKGQEVPLFDAERDASLGEAERDKLRWIPQVLELARDELGLKPGGAFTRYLDTGGQPASYAVIAAHPLALVPYRWCFPLVGCVPYKGYFAHADARKEAARLEHAGLDVEVQVVPAYSTLGWFDEPVLSTMLAYDLADLVELILHEATHRTFFIPGDTQFNESLAAHVAREGTRIFLERHAAALPEGVQERWESDVRGRDTAAVLNRRMESDLTALYVSQRPGAEIRDRKAEVFRTTRRAWALAGLSAKFSPSTNAIVLLRREYQDLVPALIDLQARAGGRPRDLMAYLERAREASETIAVDVKSGAAPP